MLWSVRETRDGLIVSPVGRLEAVMCDAFLTNLSAIISDAARADKKALTLDLAGVTNISPEGLRVLTLVKQVADEQHVAISLMRPTHRLRELLAISRLDTIFDIRPDEDDRP